MEQVYKKTGILFKLLPCLLITMYAFMCLFGSFVYAGSYTSEIYKTNIITPTFYDDAKYHFIYIYDSGGWQQATLYYSNSPIKVTVPYDTNYGYSGMYFQATDSKAYYVQSYRSDGWDFSSRTTYDKYLGVNQKTSSSLSKSLWGKEFPNALLTDYFLDCNVEIVEGKNNTVVYSPEPAEKDYTDISDIGDNFLLQGSRNIDGVDTPINIYCSKELESYKYFLAFYSKDNTDSYYLDFFFSKKPIVLSNNTITGLDNNSFYYLKLQSSYFNENTTNFNLTDFTVSSNEDFAYYSPDMEVISSQFTEDNIIYNNYDEGSYLLTDNILNDISSSINNINTSTDVSEYEKEDGSYENTSNTLIDIMKNFFLFFFDKFSFITNIFNNFNDIYNFVFNQPEVKKLYYYYYKKHDTGKLMLGGIEANFPSALFQNYDLSRDVFEYCMLDLSWYSEYKPFFDIVVAGYIYIVFVWHLFKNLTNIIQGAPSAATSLSDTFNYREVIRNEMKK